MPRERIHIPMNFDDPANRQRAAIACHQARGLCEFDLRPVRPTHSTRQRAYYFGVVVTMFRDFMREHGTEDADLEYCHSILKQKWLKEEVVIPETGEVVKRVRSITELKTSEMSAYTDNCRMWLASFGVSTPEPDPDYAFKRAEKVMR